MFHKIELQMSTPSLFHSLMKLGMKKFLKSSDLQETYKNLSLQLCYKV